MLDKHYWLLFLPCPGFGYPSPILPDPKNKVVQIINRKICVFMIANYGICGFFFFSELHVEVARVLGRGGGGVDS